MTVALLAVTAGLAICGLLAIATDRYLRHRVKPDRKVRMHLVGPDGQEVTIEGFLAGRAAGHYILRRVQQIVGPDDEVPLAGDVEVPEARVLFLQVLSA